MLITCGRGGRYSGGGGQIMGQNGGWQVGGRSHPCRNATKWDNKEESLASWSSQLL